MIWTLLLLLQAPPGREALGAFGSWAAFVDAAPRRCFAVAAPVRPGGLAAWKPFASVATWPGRGLRASFFARLSRERDRSAGVTATIGERRFALVANGTDAYAADLAGDRAIVSAMRSGRSMSIEFVAAGGKPTADVYALAGAATAADAATLACAARR